MKTFTKVLWLTLSMLLISIPAQANDAMFKSATSTFDRNMVRYDSLLSKKQFGDTHWEDKVKKSRAKLFKSLKTMDKQFPERDIASIWKKLETTEAKYAKKGATEGSPLYQLAVDTFETTLKTFNRIADKNRYGEKQWTKDINKNKKAVVKAIKNAEKRGTKKQVEMLWSKWNKRESEFDKNHKIQLARVLKQQAEEKEAERLEAERTSLKVKR